MDNTKETAASEEIKEQSQKELFQPFQWIDVDSCEARLASSVMNMIGGIQTVLEAMEDRCVRQECDEPPIFDEYYEGKLLRLAIGACQSLHLEAEDVITHLKKQKNRKSADIRSI